MIVSINLKKTKISNRTKLKASLFENRESSQQLTFSEHFYLKNKAITRLSKPKSKKVHSRAEMKGLHLKFNLSFRIKPVSQATQESRRERATFNSPKTFVLAISREALKGVKFKSHL